MGRGAQRAALPAQRVEDEGEELWMKARMLCKQRLQCWHLCGKLRQLKD